MKIFIFSFLGSFFGIITAFICLNFFKKLKDLIFSDKALDCKVLCSGIKIETYKIELDKIIDGFIKESRKTFEYSGNKLLQKLCVDLFHLKAVLTDEEKEEIVRDITLNEESEYNVDNEMPYFVKLANKYMDRIEEYRKEVIKDEIL